MLKRSLATICCCPDASLDRIIRKGNSRPGSWHLSPSVTECSRSGQATNVEAWICVRLLSWECIAMPLPPNRLRSFKTASGHQCSKGAAEELNIMQADIRRRVRLLGRQGGQTRSPRSRGMSLTEVMRRTFLGVAGTLALLARSLANHLKSSAPMVEVRCCAGVP